MDKEKLVQGLSELGSSEDIFTGADQTEQSRFSDDSVREGELIKLYNQLTEDLMRRLTKLANILVEYHFRTYQLSLAHFANASWLKGHEDDLAKCINNLSGKHPEWSYAKLFTEAGKQMEETYGVAKQSS